jgi:hypothetical protein
MNQNIVWSTQNRTGHAERKTDFEASRHRVWQLKQSPTGRDIPSERHKFFRAG